MERFRPVFSVLLVLSSGAHPLAGHEGEKVTEGLDGLRGRLQEYVSLGAKFAKWRAVITIGENMPTAACIEECSAGLGDSPDALRDYERLSCDDAVAFIEGDRGRAPGTAPVGSPHARSGSADAKP